MTAIVRRLGAASNITANTRTRLYTVPAGKVAILKCVTQGYDGGGEAILGTTINGSGWLWNSRIKDNFSSRIWPLSTVLAAGEFVEAEHNVGSAYTLLQGVELDAADAPNVVRVQFLSVQTTQGSYVVPAGKRLRIREVVLCPHNANGSVSVFVSGIGHIIERNLVALEPVVLPTDMLLNAGETLGSSGGGTTIHVFVSGVLEDA